MTTHKKQKELNLQELTTRIQEILKPGDDVLPSVALISDGIGVALGKEQGAAYRKAQKLLRSCQN